MAPLCKGGWLRRQPETGGLSCWSVFAVTTPPAAFGGHLPLHRGGVKCAAHAVPPPLAQGRRSISGALSQFTQNFCVRFGEILTHLSVDRRYFRRYNNLNQLNTTPKAMKRRVRGKVMPQRAPAAGKGCRESAEHGLGAAWAICSPRRGRPLQRRGLMEPSKVRAVRRG